MNNHINWTSLQHPLDSVLKIQSQRQCFSPLTHEQQGPQAKVSWQNASPCREEGSSQNESHPHDGAALLGASSCKQLIQNALQIQNLKLTQKDLRN